MDRRLPAKAEEVAELELAFARFEWARSAGCLHLPAQRKALEWHVACCEAALSAMSDVSKDSPAD